MKKLLKKLIKSRLGENGGVKATRPDIKLSDDNDDSRLIYDLVQDHRKTRTLFHRMRESLVYENERSRENPIQAPKMHYEWGKLSEEREFFFLQHWNSEGFLFEEDRKGWVISRAHKIEEQKRFMRHSEAWDVVTVFESNQSDCLPRLSSSRFGNDLLSYQVYQDALISSVSHDK
ncbi:MAG: hypothetical protein HRU19_17580 [Pseudobacteriovorax sp.]|nr:hypothetical protein [Pseudobacteriovorax sp.]